MRSNYCIEIVFIEAFKQPPQAVINIKESVKCKDKRKLAIVQ